MSALSLQSQIPRQFQQIQATEDMTGRKSRPAGAFDIRIQIITDMQSFSAAYFFPECLKQPLCFTCLILTGNQKIRIIFYSAFFKHFQNPAFRIVGICNDINRFSLPIKFGYQFYHIQTRNNQIIIDSPFKLCQFFCRYFFRRMFQHTLIYFL